LGKRYLLFEDNVQKLKRRCCRQITLPCVFEKDLLLRIPAENHGAVAAAAKADGKKYQSMGSGCFTI